MEKPRLIRHLTNLIIRRGDTEIQISDVINVNEFQRHVPHIFRVLKFSWTLHDTFGGVFATYGNAESWTKEVAQAFLEQNKQLVPDQSILDVLLQSSRKEVTIQLTPLQTTLLTVTFRIYSIADHDTRRIRNDY